MLTHLPCHRKNDPLWRKHRIRPTLALTLEGQLRVDLARWPDGPGMSAICAFETFERRLESTYCGRSRPRPWTGQLGGQLPVAVDSFARFAGPATYLRCATLARPPSADALQRTHQRAVGSRICCGGGTRGVLSVRRPRCRRWPRSPRRAPTTDHRTASLARSSSQIFRRWSFGKSAS
jgi:hypothetical protein